MSRGWIFFWIALFCEGLEWSHGSQSQTGETKETSDELRKRWWFIKTCSGSKPGGHAWNNDWDAHFRFNCAAGVESYHQNHQEDRRFKFRCCRHPSHYHVSSCYKTSYVNSRKGVLHYEVPNFHYLVGAESVHSNKEEDRRWKFEVCKIPAEP